MNLNKVKLINGGIKGLKIAYIETVKRGSFDYRDELKNHNIPTPVPAELKNMFYKLKKHFRVLCSLDNDILEEDAIIITGITSNEKDSFEILGYVNGSFGKIDMSHEVVTADTKYPGFAKVMKIISDIYDGVVQYKTAKMVESNKQVLMDFAEDPKTAKMMMDVDIESLTPKQQIAKAKEILEAQGAIVVMDEDMEPVEKPAEKSDKKSQMTKVA